MATVKKYAFGAMTLICGAAAGMFVVEALKKDGFASTAISYLIPAVASVAVLGFWLIYSKAVAVAIGADRDKFSRADAFSYLPLLVTLLMYARRYWPIPNLGAFLLVSAMAMALWMKGSTLYFMKRGESTFNAIVFAPPIGFALALVCQMPYADLNIPRFLIMGQAKTLGIFVIIGLAARLRSSGGGNESLAGLSKR